MTRAAENIFSDLGVGGTYSPYQNGGGRSVSGGKNQAPNSPAYSFVAGASLPLTQIDLALSYISGTNGAVVTLWSAVPWSVDVGPAFGTIAPGVQLGSWTVGPVPLASNNSGNALTTIAGIQGISLVAGTQYFLQVSAVATDTFLVWNGNTTGSTSTLSQCGGFNSTFTVCTVGIISYANVSDSGFDLLGAAPQTQPQTPITITETGVVTSYSNPSIPKGSPSPVSLGTPFTLTTVLYPSDITPLLTSPPSYAGFLQGSVTLSLGGVSYQEANPGTSVSLIAPVANGYSGIQINSGSPGSTVASTVSSSTLPILDAFTYQNGTFNYSSNVQGVMSVNNWLTVPILEGAKLGGQINTLTIQATRTTTVFSAACEAGTGCNLAAFGESATITYPYSVPLDGSTFSGPAQFTATIAGSQQTLILPSHYAFFYGPPTTPTGPNINALQQPYAEGYGTVTVAGTPPPPQFLLQPDPGLNSADFVFATIGETHFFEVYGTYANGFGFEVNDVAFTLSSQQPLQTPLQITTTSLPSAVSHQTYSGGLGASGGTGLGYKWSLASGSLPNGFILSSSGVLSTTGTPAALAKSYVFTVTVTDSAGTNATSQQLTLDVTSPPLPAVTILDPVPQLLNGAQIIPTRIILAAAGRPVQGIAADGIAQVVLRVPVLASGDQVTATLLNDQCSDLSILSTCSPSTSSDNDGGFFTIGTLVTSAAQLSNTQVDTADANTVDAFIAYRAPIDFARPSPATDTSLPTRSVYAQLTYSSGGTTYASQIVPLTIVRPPVVLIHGFNTDSSAWDIFTPFVSHSSLFAIFKADYGKKLFASTIGNCVTTPCISFQPTTTFNIQSTTPVINSFVFDAGARQSHLGFSVNARYVAAQAQAAISDFTLGNNPAGLQVAGVMADIVAHSMGGLVARYWASLPTYVDSRNFNQGYIHKLITLGTPHYGSPQAILSLLPASACSRNLAALAGSLSFSSASLANGSSVSGASAELSGDGIGTNLSQPLQTIKSSNHTIPIAAIAGYVGSIEGNIDVSPASIAVNKKCPSTDPLAARFTSAAFDTTFDPQITSANPSGGAGGRNNDGSVPLTSALMDSTANSLCGFEAGQCFVGYSHSVGIATFFEVPFAGAVNYLQDNSQSVSRQVELLLNTTVGNTTIWK